MDLSTKSVKDAAAIIGEVDQANYLAHSIREIQKILLARGKAYHITTFASPRNQQAKVIFYKSACEILLSHVSKSCKELSPSETRLILAHELGHLVCNIDRLDELANSNPNTYSSSIDEELYAWEFAYHLIVKKSEYHRDIKDRSDFIYDPEELKRDIKHLLRDIPQGVEDYEGMISRAEDVINSLNKSWVPQK
jgi:hypothetical protein